MDLVVILIHQQATFVQCVQVVLTVLIQLLNTHVAHLNIVPKVLQLQLHVQTGMIAQIILCVLMVITWMLLSHVNLVQLGTVALIVVTAT